MPRALGCGLAVAVLALTLAPGLARAGVVFEDDFDSQPDWNVNHEAEGGCDFPCATTPGSSSSGTLQWNASYAVPFSSAFAHPVASIQRPPSGTDHTGNGGKVFIGYHQSSGNYGGNGAWGGNSFLEVVLPQDYAELYARLWLKAQAGWQVEAGAGSMAKMFRIEHWDRTPGTTFEYFPAGHTAPAWVWYWYYSSVYGVRLTQGYRCSPQASDYYCQNNTSGGLSGSEEAYDGALWPGSTYADTPTTAGLWADGSWHKLDVHLKLNSAPGADDGIVQWWWDADPATAAPIFERPNAALSKGGVQWQSSSTTLPAKGWNTVGIGGNTDYVFGTGDAEQWYAIDDVVVSTDPIPAGYIIGGVRDGGAPAGDAAAAQDGAALADAAAARDARATADAADARDARASADAATFADGARADGATGGGSVTGTGCGCRAGGAGRASGGAVALALLVLAGRGRRRRGPS
ncbi:MAG TPA: hypothetical protein VGQ83_28230 [Polyangia bacterium]|jgi:MYXO-CTERM domain-containing protein